MFTALYASLSILLLCWLALKVVGARRKHQIRYADGGVEAVQIARTAHGNATEYLPIFLIALFLLEYNGGQPLLINLLGITMLGGRVIHAKGILQESFKGRVLGMQITIFTLLALAILNIIYLVISLI